MGSKKKVITTIIGAGVLVIAAAAVFLFYISSAPVRIHHQPESEQETMAKNSDSYLEGYSIISAELERTEEDALWRLEYLRYIEDFEDWINNQIADWVSKSRGIDAPTEADIRARIKYDLIYIDDDDIPELYIEYPKHTTGVFDGMEAHIITYYDGQLIDNRMEDEEWMYCDHIVCEYIERSSLCYGSFSILENFGYDIYKLENGWLRMIGSGSVFWDHSAFEWNNVVYSSPEEAERNMGIVYDASCSIKCGKSMSAEELMELVYQDTAETVYDGE